MKPFKVIFMVHWLLGDAFYLTVRWFPKSTDIRYTLILNGYATLKLMWPIFFSPKLCYVGKCKPLFFLNADKPPIQELHQFLEFQLPRQWAPILGDIPLGPDRKQSTASLQFSFMGPKLYVNTTPVMLLVFFFSFSFLMKVVFLVAITP